MQRGWWIGALLLGGSLVLGGTRPAAPEASAAQAVRPQLPTLTPTVTPPALPGCWTAPLLYPIYGRDDFFEGIKAFSDTEVWAVGSTRTLDGYVNVSRWDGMRWGPAEPQVRGSLRAIDGVAANDLWAAGSTQLHWDGSDWKIFPHPLVGYVYGLAALAHDDVWAVGGGIEHWDGNTWTTVPNPVAGAFLGAVAGRAATDVWAVGVRPDNIDQRSLIEHWDGTAWAVVPSPTLQNSDLYLSGVAVEPSGRAWAVGSYVKGGQTYPLIERWDGAAWAVLPSPRNGLGDNHLNSVTVAGPDNVWAVGSYTGLSTNQTLTMHWDGLRWSIVPSAELSLTDHDLAAVSAAAPDRVWAAGNRVSTQYYVDHETLIEHFSAECPPPPPCSTDFQLVDSPSRGDQVGVAVVSPRDVWAIGNTLTHWDGVGWSVVAYPAGVQSQAITKVPGPNASNDLWIVGQAGGATATLHWDGSAWARVPSPIMGSGANLLQAVSALGPNDVWAAGSYYQYGLHGLVEHWDGTAWRIVTLPDMAPVLGITAVSPTEVWIVSQSTSYEWNGQAWRVHPLPAGTTLAAVGGQRPDQVWAVGHINNGSGAALHWTGRAWVSTFSEPFYGHFTAVAVLAAADIWAVGSYGSGSDTSNDVQHWDGSTWTYVEAPNRDGRYNHLFGVAGLSSRPVWLVGGSGMGHTVTEQAMPTCSPPAKSR